MNRVQLAIPGEHNILNALAAYTCACALRAGLELINLHERMRGQGSAQPFPSGMPGSGSEIR